MNIDELEMEMDLKLNDKFSALLSRWQQGCEFLGSKYALMGGAMSWISERNLVSAIANAGGFGVIACGAMEVDMLRNEIIATQKLTDKPFGVNLITMHPQINELIDVCIELKTTHIVLGGSLPPSAAIKKIKDSNIKLMCFAPNLALAKRMIRSGADALIIEGSEAGGHIGPVATSVLVQEILGNVDVPVFVAGGIGNGKIAASYLMMGACGCQMGTMFVCSEECIAHSNFKNVFIKSASREAIISVQVDENFPVIPVRAIKNKASKEFARFQQAIITKYNNGELEKKEAQLNIEKYWAGALKKAVIDGDIENGSLMAGQSVGMIKEIKPVRQIIENLMQELVDTLCRHE